MKFIFEVVVEVNPDGENAGFTDRSIAEDYDYKIEGLIGEAVSQLEVELDTAAEESFAGASGVEVTVNLTREEWT